MKYIGMGFRDKIGKGINFYLYNRMLTLVLWTPVLKRPSTFYYNKECFEHGIEMKNITPTHYIGLTIE